MYQPSLDDTIAAIATPVGQGGIGIIRLSGKKSLRIADQIFANTKKTKPSQFKSYTVHFGWIVQSSKFKVQKSKLEDEIIDEVLLTVMRTPKSYTREDVVEISCHGGTVPLQAILNLTLKLGARLAEPGEFTKRAFLNGRIDLAQAEAVLDIIQSKTDVFLRASMNQLKGELTLELEGIREVLMSWYTEIEAIVNFPEDDIDASTRRQLLVKTASAKIRVDQLLESGKHGRILKEGIRVVLCGKPNVGKSSLLNRLLKAPRAIVTDIAGTTRDTIEESAQIKGIPFQLVDTAGMLEPRDSIEEEAVKRSHLSIEKADLVLFVVDSSRPLSGEDDVLIEKLKDRNVIVVINKCDLPGQINEGKIKKLFKDKKILKVSALQKIGLDDLEDVIVDNVWGGKMPEAPRLLVTNARHIHSLQNCALALEKAKTSLAQDVPLEFISEAVKEAVNYLDGITGRQVEGDLLDKIFSDFCIGK